VWTSISFKRPAFYLNALAREVSEFLKRWECRSSTGLTEFDGTISPVTLSTVTKPSSALAYAGFYQDITETVPLKFVMGLSPGPLALIGFRIRATITDGTNAAQL